MSENFENNQPPSGGTNSDDYPSVNREQIEAARAAGNTWMFREREMEMFVARGFIESATEINDPATNEPTGILLIHQFGWENQSPFIKREKAFKTSLQRVGRATKQRVKTTNLIPVNAEFYSELIQGGIIRRFENGEPVDTPKSREEMLEFARLYPESASEAIEAWLESAKFKLLVETDGNNLDWMFSSQPVKKVLWYLGDEENPVAAGILTFNSPPKEERERYDDEVQNIESDRKGDVSFAELSENFGKKIQYGSKHLASVEGIAVEAEGNPYSANNKQKFIVLFNPLWFVEAIELVHESFNFTKGKSAKN